MTRQWDSGGEAVPGGTLNNEHGIKKYPEPWTLHPAPINA